jgi:ubiquinone/menaquinone biosynthesis C-methylase UbiE
MSASLDTIVPLLRCPRCGQSQATLQDDRATCSGCGAVFPVEGGNILIQSAQDELPADWAAQQQESIARYQDEHYEEDETIAKLFGGFIAVTLNPGDKVLDVGCGLFPDLPAYARDLRMGRYIGLEPLTTMVPRNYACLVGAVAEDIPLRDGSIDAAVLSTSIDHIADIDKAMAELKRILAPGGRMYLWVGVHEPEMLARSKTFHNILYYGSKAKRLARILLAQGEYAWLLYQMRKRGKDLALGKPLDHAHCRYYTQERLKTALEGWGLDAPRFLLIPGTASVLVEARPR